MLIPKTVCRQPHTSDSSSLHLPTKIITQGRMQTAVSSQSTVHCPAACRTPGTGQAITKAETHIMEEFKLIMNLQLCSFETL